MCACGLMQNSSPSRCAITAKEFRPNGWNNSTGQAAAWEWDSQECGNALKTYVAGWKSSLTKPEHWLGPFYPRLTGGWFRARPTFVRARLHKDSGSGSVLREVLM